MPDPTEIQPGYSPKPIKLATAEATNDSPEPESQSDETTGTALMAPLTPAPALPKTGEDGIVEFK